MASVSVGGGGGHVRRLENEHKETLHKRCEANRKQKSGRRALARAGVLGRVSSDPLLTLYACSMIGPETFQGKRRRQKVTN